MDAPVDNVGCNQTPPFHYWACTRCHGPEAGRDAGVGSKRCTSPGVQCAQGPKLARATMYVVLSKFRFCGLLRNYTLAGSQKQYGRQALLTNLRRKRIASTQLNSAFRARTARRVFTCSRAMPCGARDAMLSWINRAVREIHARSAPLVWHGLCHAVLSTATLFTRRCGLNRNWPVVYA